MDKNMTASGWIFDVLGYAETFTGKEIQKALNASTSTEKNRVSRSLSYLVEAGKIKRLRRGVFKKLSRTVDYSLTLRSAYCENFRTTEEVNERVDAMKVKRSPCEFIELPLWGYEGRTGKLYRIQKPQKEPRYHNTEYLLRIDANDPQLKRVLRYATAIVNGAILIILIKGIADIRKLLPKLKWF